MNNKIEKLRDDFVELKRWVEEECNGVYYKITQEENKFLTTHVKELEPAQHNHNDGNDDVGDNDDDNDVDSDKEEDESKYTELLEAMAETEARTKQIADNDKAYGQ